MWHSAQPKLRNCWANLLFVLAVEAVSIVVAVMAGDSRDDLVGKQQSLRHDVRDAELKYSCLGAG